MQNTLRKRNKFYFEADSGLYEDYQKTDQINLEVELSGNLIVFSINWVDHDISVAGITIEQAKNLVGKLNNMIDKIQYEETIEYFRGNKKLKLHVKK